MADSNCSHELNKQIQGLQARLSQAENNIHAQFIGTSQLVAALAGTPAAAAAVIMGPIYNLEATGFALMQKLKDLIPTIDTKKLMMEMASSLIDSMAAELDALLEAVEASLLAAVNAALDSLNAAISVVTDAQDALTAAIEGGNALAIAAAEDALDSANSAKNAAQSLFDGAEDALATASNFMKGQANVAKCKSESFFLTK